MILVGVTGGIGAGKTSALGCFKDLGAETVDADDIVHGLYAPGGPAYQAALGRWGPRIAAADGQIDRRAVAEIVFADQEELAWLNAVIHPLVRSRLLACREDSRPVLLFCGVPLLFETGWTDLFRCSIAVWCDPLTQQQRLRDRGWSDKDSRKRTQHQMSMDAKLERADLGLINTGSLTLFRSQCEAIHDRLRHDVGG